MSVDYIRWDEELYETKSLVGESNIYSLSNKGKLFLEEDGELKDIDFRGPLLFFNKEESYFVCVFNDEFLELFVLHGSRYGKEWKRTFGKCYGCREVLFFTPLVLDIDSKMVNFCGKCGRKHIKATLNRESKPLP